jgi:hypothetical protein
MAVCKNRVGSARGPEAWGGGACPVTSQRGLHEHGLGGSVLVQDRWAWYAPCRHVRTGTAAGGGGGSLLRVQYLRQSSILGSSLVLLASVRWLRLDGGGVPMAMVAQVGGRCVWRITMERPGQGCEGREKSQWLWLTATR